MRALAASLAALLLASPALAADPVQGRWITEEKDAMPDAEEWDGKENKIDLLSREPGEGS